MYYLKDVIYQYLDNFIAIFKVEKVILKKLFE